MARRTGWNPNSPPGRNPYPGLGGPATPPRTVGQAPAPTTFGSYDPAAGFQRDATLANDAYSRFLAQQRGQRQLGQIDITNTAGLNPMAESYGHRGLGYSGIYHQAQSDYAQSWMNQRQTALDNLYNELRTATLGDQNAWNQFGQNVASTGADKTQQIYQTAAQLQQIKPYFGG